MNRDVLISIKGTVVAEDAAPDVIELITAGRYAYKDGSYYISYNETQDSGFGGVTTTLKVEGDRCVTLTRSGPSSTRMVLEKGRRHLSQYDTGYGQMMVGVSGTRIQSDLSEAGGELSLHYALDINSSVVSQNEVYITVKEAPKTVC